MNILAPLVLASALGLGTAASAATPGPAADTRPTVVLVHGAFADGSSWNRVIPLLQAEGLNTVAVQNPLTSLEDDVAAANRIITSCALTNMATGALVFLPGADYPVMALAQVGMLFELAAVFGRGIKPERGYEVAGVLAGGLVIRAVTRALVKQTPHIGFAVKALTAAAGTYGMGRALVSLYERDVDYSRANEVVTATFSRVRDLVTTVAGATRPMASYQDASDLAA